MMLIGNRKEIIASYCVACVLESRYCFLDPDFKLIYRANLVHKKQTDNCTIYKMELIDYGQTREIKSIEGIRVLPKEIAKINKLAIPCCMQDLSPANGKWDENAKMTMYEIIE